MAGRDRVGYEDSLEIDTNLAQLSMIQNYGEQGPIYSSLGEGDGMRLEEADRIPAMEGRLSGPEEDIQVLPLPRQRRSRPLHSTANHPEPTLRRTTRFSAGPTLRARQQPVSMEMTLQDNNANQGNETSHAANTFVNNINALIGQQVSRLYVPTATLSSRMDLKLPRFDG